MESVEKIRKYIVEGLFNKPKLGEHYINWHTNNSNECGVTIIYKNQNEKFDIIIKQK